VTATRTNLRSLLAGTQRMILFVPEVARWLGTIEAALILQQVCYLADENDECVFGPKDAEQYAISRRPFDAARKAIEAKGIASARRVGAVPRLLWSVDFDALQETWDEWEVQNPDPDSGGVRNVHLEKRGSDVSSRANRTSPTTALEDEEQESTRATTQTPDPASGKCKRCASSTWIPDLATVDDRGRLIGDVLPCPDCNPDARPDDPRYSAEPMVLPSRRLRAVVDTPDLEAS
jgi:hypothetical protein